MTNLTKNEAYALASYIDDTLIGFIKDDPDIYSIYWLRRMVHAYEKLCKYSGYVGMTESKEEWTENAKDEP